jgi:hypothetical protein
MFPFTAHYKTELEIIGEFEYNSNHYCILAYDMSKVNHIKLFSTKKALSNRDQKGLLLFIIKLLQQTSRNNDTLNFRSSLVNLSNFLNHASFVLRGIFTTIPTVNLYRSLATPKQSQKRII